MKAFLSEPNGPSSGYRTALGVLLMLAGCLCQSAAQAASSPNSSSQAVQDHFAAAQQAQQQGDYATAENEYKTILTIAPDFAEVHMNLGLIYQLENRTGDAMAEFRHALKIKPTLAGANFFLGIDYCKNGDGKKAIPYLKAASRLDPKRSDIWSWLAIAEEISGDTQGEVATLKRAVELHPADVDLLYLLGRAYERLGGREVATLESVAPGSSWSEQLLAEGYSSSSEWSLAVIRFQNALAISPTQPGLHVGLGEAFLRAGRLDQATREFEEELRVDPNSLRAILRRGEGKLIKGDLDAALDDWARATTMDQPRTERILGIREMGFGDAALEQLPDSFRERVQALASQLKDRQDPAAHLALAFLAVQSGDTAPITTRPDPMTRSNPASSCTEARVREALRQGKFSSVEGCLLRILTARSSAKFRVEVASALYELGDYENSLKALAGLSDQNSAPAFYWRARCFEKLATAAYLRLYQADPNSYRVHQLIGDLEAAKGNDGKAIDEYRIAVAMKPSVPNLHYSLGHLLWKDLKTDEARHEFEAELEINPRHAGALHDLGDTYLLEHQPEKALPYLTRALAADPGDPDIHRDLGTGYADLHDYGKAETEFKAALPGDHDGSVHYKLARVYQAKGQKENAAHEFDISTSRNRESHSKLEKQTQRLNEIEGSASAHP
jgi:tetratricopeptide (TPR) repeat protein